MNHETQESSSGSLGKTCQGEEENHNKKRIYKESAEPFGCSPEEVAKILLNGGRLIPLTRGKFAIVDEDDYESINSINWCCMPNGYAYSRTSRKDGPRKTIYMHRLIGKTPDGMETDHANKNKLDNRKCNLRAATRAQNQRNKGLRKDNKSGFAGVLWTKRLKKWMAKIHVNGRDIYLGSFKTKEQAHEAYKKAAVIHHKEFAA